VSLEGNRYGMTREVEIEGLPKSMDEALQYDETAKDEQRRMGGGAGRAAFTSWLTDKELIAKTSRKICCNISS